MKRYKDKNRGTTLLSKCEMCDSKKSRFIKSQEASGLLNRLGIKRSISSKVPVARDILF